ncbi:MAG: hypothetical protein F6K17_10345 [Okeania sp. SIO3C4]|nr:hypothetical protein [Okeania sp. SIO3C4]
MALNEVRSHNSEVRSYFCHEDLSKAPKTRSPVKAGLRDPILFDNYEIY